MASNPIVNASDRLPCARRSRELPLDLDWILKLGLKTMTPKVMDSAPELMRRRLPLSFETTYDTY